MRTDKFFVYYHTYKICETLLTYTVYPSDKASYSFTKIATSAVALTTGKMLTSNHLAVPIVGFNASYFAGYVLSELKDWCDQQLPEKTVLEAYCNTREIVPPTQEQYFLELARINEENFQKTTEEYGHECDDECELPDPGANVIRYI